MTAAPPRYRGDLPPLGFNMARYCLRAGNASREKVALIAVHGLDGRGDEPWRYGDLETAVLRAVRAFRGTLGLKIGDRVAIRLRNRTSYPLAFYGAIAGGLVPIPLSPDLTERELAFVLDDSQAAAVVLDDTLPHGSFHAGLTIMPENALLTAVASGPTSDYAETAADDPAFLIYTSGTTASPKGVLHAHRSAWGRRPMYRGWYDISANDRLMHAGSFNWTYTLGTGLSDTWANGATAIVYTGEKTPEVWPGLLTAYNVSIFAAVPGVYRQILKYAKVPLGSFPTLRHGLTAGEALPEAVSREWTERTGTVLYEALGQSEISTYISSSPSVPPRPGTSGKSQPGRCVAIVSEDGGFYPLPPGSEGLIAVHRTDPGLMLGYWRLPDAEAEALRGEWFIGGDAGVIDEDGYVTHLGRRDELMNAGGFRVSPSEVEQEIAKHPAVSEVAVAEIPVREGVSIIEAFVVPAAEAHFENLASELHSFASHTLATYKRPKSYVILPSLPRTPNGKIRRADLRRLRGEKNGMG